jgi:2-C-methyl-D-erythritol 4-phosphate cytidylyltransferase
VRIGLAEVPEDAAVVVVHDAARPVLPEELVARVLAPLSEGWDGAVPGLAPADTVKRVDGEQVVETLARDRLVTVQTPQAFVAEALRAAAADGDASDCAGLVERRGGRVKVVAGDPRLVKVTTSEDLELAGWWLDRQAPE